MVTNDLNGVFETADNTTLSLTIFSLEGCLNCRVTVSAKNSVGYGPKDVEEIKTKSGKCKLNNSVCAYWLFLS